MRRLSNALLLRFLLVPTGLFPYYCCLAGRSPPPRRDGSSFSPIGRFDLTTDQFPFLSFFQKLTIASATATATASTNCKNGNNSNNMNSSSSARPRRVTWNNYPSHDRRSNDSLLDDFSTRTTLGDEEPTAPLPLPPQESTREAKTHPAVIFKRRLLPTEEQVTPTPTTATNNNPIHDLALQLSQPLIPQEAWDRMMTMSRSDGEKDGDFLGQDEEAVEALTKSGLQLCRTSTITTSATTHGDNVKEKNLVEWVPHASTTKVLEDHGQDKEAALKEGNVLVYVGTILQEDVVGAGLPMIKTESILPMAARDMANLLMDSSKVPIYNKMSLGRTDVKIIQNKNNKDSTSPFFSITKIVRNITKPPLAQSSMVSVTLMHSRPLQDDDHLASTGGFVVVSRAVPGMVGEEFQEMPRNDILMGVNVLQDRSSIVPSTGNEQQLQQPQDECFMTAVTHVYSPALPKLLAKSMGVTSAVNFVRDIRESCRPQP